jgi:hypothetical protein
MVVLLPVFNTQIIPEIFPAPVITFDPGKVSFIYASVRFHAGSRDSAWRPSYSGLSSKLPLLTATSDGPNTDFVEKTRWLRLPKAN